MATAIPVRPMGARSEAGGRGALASLSLSMLLSSLGTSASNVALPALAAAFDASFAEVQWVVLAYLLAVTVSIVSVGRLGDLVGRARLLRLGLALFVAASALCGLAPTLGTLVAARALQGLAGAVLMALSVALVGESVPRERTGRALGLLGTMSAVGTALGPSLGGLLLAASGWRAIFLVNLPLGVLALVLTARTLPAHTGAPRRAEFDGTGTAFLAVALLAYALAMTSGPGRPGASLLLAALGAAGVFARVEARASAPLVQLQVLRVRALLSGLVASALVATVIMATLVVGPFYLAHGLGLEAAGVGLVMSTGPLVAALAGVPSGRLVDRLGASRVGPAGLAGMLAGCVLLSTTSPELGVPGYLVPLALLTGSYALFQTANNTSVMLGAGPDHRGAVSGLLSLSRNLGLITGTAAMGALFTLGAGGDVAAAGTAGVASGLRLVFAVAAAVVVAGLGLSCGVVGRLLGFVLVLAGGLLLRGESTRLAATAPQLHAHRPDFERPATAPGLSRPRLQRGAALRPERPLAAPALVRVPVPGTSVPTPGGGELPAPPAPRAADRASAVHPSCSADASSGRPPGRPP